MPEAMEEAKRNFGSSSLSRVGGGKARGGGIISTQRERWGRGGRRGKNTFISFHSVDSFRRFGCFKAV